MWSDDIQRQAMERMRSLGKKADKDSNLAIERTGKIKNQQFKRSELKDRKEIREWFFGEGEGR